MADNKINVGGRLHSIATGNVLAGADEILDDSKNKKQSDINTETYNLVNEVNAKLDSLSPEQQSALAVAAKANKNEANLGYYICETEANVATKVIANATGYVLSAGGSIKVKMINTNTATNATLNINSTGAKPLYYEDERASANNSWEAGETVEVYYDGTNFYANNVAGGSGLGDGAFDVSAKYPTSGVDGGNTYTLDGALAVLNTNLPASKKKGGMSIKFVLTSDNKYVQYRLMSDSFNTTPSNWQSMNVDDEPTAGSNNLVKSGGVFNLITPVINVNVETLVTFDHKYVVYDTGEIATSAQTTLANIYFIQLSDNFPNKIRACIGNNSYGTVAVIAFFSSLEHTQDSYIKSSSVPGVRNVNEGIWYEASVPENTKLIVISNLSSIVEIPEIELYYQKYAEYSEFKEEKNRSAQKDEELEQNIEQVKIDTFDKDVVPELEMGNIAMSASGWRYTNSTTRVRTKEGTSIHLNVGDRIYLTDHNEAKMYISWKTSENVYENVGWILNGEFNVVEEGDYVILLAKRIESETTVEELAQILKVISYSKKTKELLSEKYVENLSCFFYPLKEKMGLGIANETISANANSYILYTKVKKNDKLLVVSRFLTLEVLISNLRYGFTNVEPIENVAITSSTNWTSISGGWNTLFSVEEDGFFCIAILKSYFISYIDSISIYNVNSFITPNDLTGVLSDFITQEQASELFAQKNDLISKDLNTIYPVASSLIRYHHLFMDEITNDSTVIVPSQSITDVRIAAKLGFNMMEINNMKTLDNVWICRHQVNGNFEGLVDNTSDEVVAVPIGSISYNDLKNNYRYKSIIPQARTSVATLDETLAEMRKYNIQPFIYLYDENILASVRKYFGNRFVAYRSGTTRPENLKGITAFVYSQANTVADIKAAIDGWGAPYMHGLASPNSFTDAELTELLAYAHSKGCSLGWAAGYSSEQANQHYRDLGLDFCSSGWDIPEFEYGNVIDIQGNSLNGFANFTLSSGASTDSDGVIVLAAGESISASAASKLLGKCLLDVTFKGNVKVTMGKHIVNSSFVESEIKERVFTSIMENEALAFTITAESETRIYSVDFKGSQVV